MLPFKELKNRLIRNGIKNIHTFGYAYCTFENILIDPVYAALFKSLLIENKGSGKIIDDAIDELLNEIKY